MPNFAKNFFRETKPSQKYWEPAPSNMPTSEHSFPEASWVRSKYRYPAQSRFDSHIRGLSDGERCHSYFDRRSYITDDLMDGRSICITHPSEQEAVGTSRWNEISSDLQALKKCCSYCRGLWEEQSTETTFYKPLQLSSQTLPCQAARNLQGGKIRLHDIYPAKLLGDLTCRSDMRSRASLEDQEKHQVEMDWSLFTGNHWPESLYRHSKIVSSDLYFSGIIAQADVQATGRTSGHQTGKINTARCLINHGSRYTEEWTVIKGPKGSKKKDWMTGGIGVDGDSGAWTIDEKTNALYGMVWGRDRVFTDPICLFTPILDIVEDIKERTGAKTVELPGSEIRVPNKGKETEKGKMPISTTPIITHHREDTTTSGSPQIRLAEMVIGNRVH